MLPLVLMLLTGTLKTVAQNPPERRLSCAVVYVALLSKLLSLPAASSSTDAASTATLLCEQPVVYKWNGGEQDASLSLMRAGWFFRGEMLTD